MPFDPVIYLVLILSVAGAIRSRGLISLLTSSEDAVDGESVGRGDRGRISFLALPFREVPVTLAAGIGCVFGRLPIHDRRFTVPLVVDRESLVLARERSRPAEIENGVADFLAVLAEFHVAKNHRFRLYNDDLDDLTRIET